MLKDIDNWPQLERADHSPSGVHPEATVIRRRRFFVSEHDRISFPSKRLCELPKPGRWRNRAAVTMPVRGRGLWEVVFFIIARFLLSIACREREPEPDGNLLFPFEDNPSPDEDDSAAADDDDDAEDRSTNYATSLCCARFILFFFISFPFRDFPPSTTFRSLARLGCKRTKAGAHNRARSQIICFAAAGSVRPRRTRNDDQDQNSTINKAPGDGRRQGSP